MMMRCWINLGFYTLSALHGWGDTVDAVSVTPFPEATLSLGGDVEVFSWGDASATLERCTCRMP